MTRRVYLENLFPSISIVHFLYLSAIVELVNTSHEIHYSRNCNISLVELEQLKLSFSEEKIEAFCQKGKMWQKGLQPILDNILNF